MMKKVLIALGIALALFVVASTTALAAVGIDNWQAFLKTQEAALKGLRAYFEFLIDLFKLVIS